LIYNHSCQELAVYYNPIGSSGTDLRLSNRGNNIYRLRSAGGSRLAGIWNPDYFGFFYTPGQLHKKFDGSAEPDSWGGALVREQDSRKYFLPLRGLAVSVTAIVSINRTGAKDGGVRDATLTLYEPSKRESIQLAGPRRALDADFTASRKSSKWLRRKHYQDTSSHHGVETCAHGHQWPIATVPSS
jgi:hypothetical protein